MGTQHRQHIPGSRVLKSLGPALKTGVSAALLAAILACASQTVGHLKQHPWSLDQPQSLHTNYLSFDFLCSQNPKGLQVRGQAYPRPDGPIPDWATWARDLWLGVYLSDRSGQVLAQKIEVLPSQALSRTQPIEFSFVLKPHSMGEPGPVFISFGYRLVLAPGPEKKTAQSAEDREDAPVFFASESALTRF